MTHAELVKRAGAWLRRTIGCGVVVEEHSGGGEHPDAMGWKCGLSWMVECKVSRSDFFRDRRKSSRQRAFESRPAFQCYYLCPKGLLRVEDMPDYWGLLWAEGRRIVVAKRAQPESSYGKSRAAHDEYERRHMLNAGFAADERHADAIRDELLRLYQEVRRYQAQGITYRSGVELHGVPCRTCGNKHYPDQKCKVCHPKVNASARPRDLRLALTE